MATITVGKKIDLTEELQSLASNNIADLIISGKLKLPVKPDILT